MPDWITGLFYGSNWCDDRRNWRRLGPRVLLVTNENIVSSYMWLVFVDLAKSSQRWCDTATEASGTSKDVCSWRWKRTDIGIEHMQGSPVALRRRACILLHCGLGHFSLFYAIRFYTHSLPSSTSAFSLSFCYSKKRITPDPCIEAYTWPYFLFNQTKWITIQFSYILK